jgi:hypothetical protein
VSEFEVQPVGSRLPKELTRLKVVTLHGGVPLVNVDAVEWTAPFRWFKREWKVTGLRLFSGGCPVGETPLEDPAFLRPREIFRVPPGGVKLWLRV